MPSGTCRVRSSDGGAKLCRSQPQCAHMSHLWQFAHRRLKSCSRVVRFPSGMEWQHVMALDIAGWSSTQPEHRLPRVKALLADAGLRDARLHDARWCSQVGLPPAEAASRGGGTGQGQGPQAMARRLGHCLFLPLNGTGDDATYNWPHRRRKL